MAHDRAVLMYRDLLLAAFILGCTIANYLYGGVFTWITFVAVGSVAVWGVYGALNKRREHKDSWFP